MMKQGQKRTKCRRGLAVLLASAMLVTAGMTVGANADCEDSHFGVSVGYMPDEGWDSNVRYKDNASSVYVYQKGSASLWVVTYGVPNSGTRSNETKHSYAIVPGYSKRRIYNYIFENGYRKAQINLTSTSSGSTIRAYGDWSPDCCGSYPVANP